MQIPIFLLTIALAACSETPDSQHVQLPGSIVLKPGIAAVIASAEALRTPNYWNALCAQPLPPYGLAKNLPAGFVTPKGKLVRPSVRLRNSSGAEDAFDVLGNLGGQDGDWICFHSAQGAKRHSPYTEVILVSTEEVHVGAIRWHSSDK